MYVVLQCVAVRCIVLQCVAAIDGKHILELGCTLCCSVLQCVALCCGVNCKHVVDLKEGISKMRRNLQFSFGYMCDTTCDMTHSYV